MPKNDTTIEYGDLSDLEQGFADCLVETESEGSFPDEWEEITVHDFSKEALWTIVQDCKRFVKAIVGEIDGTWPSLFDEDVSDHDIGWYFYAQRQGTGQSFGDIVEDDELSARLTKGAEELGALEVEIGGDHRIHISRHREWTASPTT